MNKMIAKCGLDCSKCEARIATISNNDELRQEVSKKWSEWNKVEIKPMDINCVGCNCDGIHFAYCESMCPIKICAASKSYLNCGKCEQLNSCDKIKMIIGNNKEAYNNLTK